MITLFRCWMLFAKKVKLKLAFYSFLEEMLKEVANNREEIEKKLMPYIAELAHSQAMKEREAEKNKA